MHAGTHAAAHSDMPQDVTSPSWPTSNKNLTNETTQKNTLTISVSVQSPAGYWVRPLGPVAAVRSRGGGPLECPGPRMWQLLPSWDALPQRCFPGYQVRGKPPPHGFAKVNCWCQTPGYLPCVPPSSMLTVNPHDEEDRRVTGRSCWWK